MTNNSASLKRRKGQAKDQSKSKKSEPQVDVHADEIRDSRFSEPLPTFPKQRVWTRIVVVLGTLIVVYFTSSQDKIVNLAKVKDSVNNRKQDVKCSQDYLDEVSEFKGCIPSSCGRVVMDHVVTTEEADLLLDLAKRGLSMGGGSGGASILDLHSGALSKGDVFVDLYSSFNVSELFTLEDFAVYIRVRRKIQEAVAMNFKLQADKLYLTKPTFFHVSPQQSL
uniref:Uncharacterized protein n=1 Tax=Lygus hesperus TaxID=30085 RepID=A0A0A9ZAU2_LYGHE